MFWWLDNLNIKWGNIYRTRAFWVRCDGKEREFPLFFRGSWESLAQPFSLCAFLPWADRPPVGHVKGWCMGKGKWKRTPAESYSDGIHGDKADRALLAGYPWIRAEFGHPILSYITAPSLPAVRGWHPYSTEYLWWKEVPCLTSRAQVHFLNSLRPSDAIWRHRSGSTLAQVMACCLTAPSHYLNQCWLIISKV